MYPACKFRYPHPAVLWLPIFLVTLCIHSIIHPFNPLTNIYYLKACPARDRKMSETRLLPVWSRRLRRTGPLPWLWVGQQRNRDRDRGLLWKRGGGGGSSQIQILGD